MPSENENLREKNIIRLINAALDENIFSITLNNGLVLTCPRRILGEKYSQENLGNEVRLDMLGETLIFPQAKAEYDGGHAEFYILDILRCIPGITADHFFFTKEGHGLGC